MSTLRDALAADNFEWPSLYNAVSHMMARLGADGSISTDAVEVERVMDALHRLDAGQFVPGLTPRAALAQSDAQPEFCCEHAWRHAKEVAWKERDLLCDCDHNVSCEKCWPLDFRHGGKWSAYKAASPQKAQPALERLSDTPGLLSRWGRGEEGTAYLFQRRDDGYWTPWHIAQAALAAQAEAHAVEIELLVGQVNTRNTELARLTAERDCRLCANYTTKAGGCVSVVQCVDSMQFRPTAPRQYWIAGPNATQPTRGGKP